MEPSPWHGLWPVEWAADLNRRIRAIDPHAIDFPKWLAWLPEIHIEGAEVQVPAPATADFGVGAE